VARERERLEYQNDQTLRGCKQTFPFNLTLDYRANAENNIRNGWIEQGIWNPAWGPAWPDGTKPSDNRWFYSRSRPDGPSPSGR
jgi:hypothetical protein